MFIFSVTQLLQNIQQIAEHNNFFDPGFRPSEMDDIPELYHRIIDDPAVLHDRLIGVHSKLCLLHYLYFPPGKSCYAQSP